MHHGPSVSCQEFKPKQEKPESEGFCVNCANFENVNGIPICAKDHSPGVACGAFRNKNVN